MEQNNGFTPPTLDETIPSTSVPPVTPTTNTPNNGPVPNTMPMPTNPDSKSTSRRIIVYVAIALIVFLVGIAIVGYLLLVKKNANQPLSYNKAAQTQATSSASPNVNGSSVDQTLNATDASLNTSINQANTDLNQVNTIDASQDTTTGL